MCIIILNKKDHVLTKEVLKNAFMNNPDGAGFGYVKDNKLIVDKGYFDFNEFYNKYTEIKSIADSDIIIHCRISTGGKINKKCCHPFKVSDGLIMAHNGILPLQSTSNQSDTMVFIERYLKNLDTNTLNNPHFSGLLRLYIGDNNKLVFLTGKGHSIIINSQAGHFDDVGNWYSNNSCKYNINYFTECDETFKISKKTEKQLYKVFDKMSMQDFKYFGDNPYINVNTYEFLPESLGKLAKDFIPLYTVDSYLYDDYYTAYTSFSGTYDMEVYT